MEESATRSRTIATVVEWLRRLNSRFGMWSLRIVCVLILLGANHGVLRWIVGGLLIASFLLDLAFDIPVWLARRKPSDHDGPGPTGSPRKRSSDSSAL
jgi:hypothetical protein